MADHFAVRESTLGSWSAVQYLPSARLSSLRETLYTRLTLLVKPYDYCVLSLLYTEWWVLLGRYSTIVSFDHMFGILPALVSPCAEANRCSATRSACAAIVKAGFTAVDEG